MQPTKEGKISVSVMCSDLMNLERDIKQLERNGVDYLHVDVMDAPFVPNLTFGVAAPRRFRDEHGPPEREIWVGGSVSGKRARLMRDMGASIFVGGTAGIYRKGMTLDESIPLFRQAIK